MSDDIVVTGIGLILPNCDDRETFWRHLRGGESQLSLTPDPADASKVVPLGKIANFDPKKYVPVDIPERYYQRFGRAQQLYVASLFRACEDAGLNRADLRSDRVGLFDGTSRDHLDVWCRYLGGEPLTKRDVAVANSGMGIGLAAALLGVRGPTYTFTNTCASGIVAIGHALRELALGEIDIAFAGGHDAALLPPVYQMYRNAGLLNLDCEDAKRAIRPFGGNSKNALSEGAVSLVLERRAHAEARGAKILAVLAGFRYGNGGLHPTDIDDTGRRAADLLERVLARAAVKREQVGFVVGHGNGVEPSDGSEVKYMRQVFGDHVKNVPLLSIKPVYGHMLGASGALNAAATVMMLERQYVVPTINVDPAVSATDVSHQAHGGEPRASESGAVVCFGIGGHNAVLLFKRAS
jgi:3-oxoacyl-[acyl-carrier-protein] synthase II